MKTIWALCLAMLVAAVVLTSIVIAAVLVIEGEHPAVERAAYYALYFDVVKAVWVGVGVAVLVAVIPAALSEARFGFERLKESRAAYSEAKTGIDYLPIRLSTLDMKRASALIQRVHFYKHQAELYDELELHLRRRGFAGTRTEWGDLMYDKLFRARTLLEQHADRWDDLASHERLALLLEEQPSVKET